MEAIQEIIGVRIDALQHTRQAIAILGGGIAGGYVIVSGLSYSQSAMPLFLESAFWLTICPKCWCLFPMAISISLLLMLIMQIMAVFLLTDSIHNYSKMLEYGTGKLLSVEEKGIHLSHRRALAADDLSYFCVRASVVFMLIHLLLLSFILFGVVYGSLSCFVTVVSVPCILFVSFGIVLYCYRASHHEIERSRSICQDIYRFWNPNRWKDAANKSVYGTSES
jgi:hypothetical protein